MPDRARTNALQCIPRTEIAAAEWDALIRTSPDGWAFSLFGWQGLILAVSEWGLRKMSFGLRENGRLVAVGPPIAAAFLRPVGEGAVRYSTDR